MKYLKFNWTNIHFTKTKFVDEKLKYLFFIKALHMRIFLFFFIFLITHNLKGQYYQTELLPYSIKNGLVNNEVNHIIKDNEGYIWIATDGGISRFDGNNFINFNSSTNPSIFKKNKIKNILKNGDLLYLITESDGLIELQPSNFTFRKPYSLSPLSMSFYGDTTALLFPNGKLIVKIKNKKIKELKFNVSPQDNLIICKGSIFVSLQKKGIIKFEIKSENNYPKIQLVNLYNNGKLIFSKKYGIIHYNGNEVKILKNNKLVDHPKLKGKFQISFFSEDDTNNILFIEKSRMLNIFHQNKFVSLTTGKNENLQLKNIIKISPNYYLVGTNQGMFNISRFPALFENLNDNLLLEENNMIVRRSILQSSNKIYFLTYPYIIEQSDKLKYITKKILPVADGIILKNKLFFITDGNGLFSLNLDTKKLLNHISHEIGATESFEEISIIDNSKILLVGGNKIVLFNPSDETAKSYFMKTGTVIHNAVQNNTTHIIYLATNYGVKRIRLSEESGIEYLDKKNDFEFEVRDILLRENKDQMWLATDNGIIVKNLNNTKTFKVYSNNNEISNKKVTKLIEDKHDQIWASTYSGITIYNTKKGTTIFLSNFQGAINNEYNYRSGVLLENGDIIFGGLNSYELIHTKKINQFSYKSDFFISAIEWIDNNNSRYFSRPNSSQDISFNTRNQSIKIQLTNFDYQYGKGYIYKYSLDSKNWFKTDENNCILITNLTYGDYDLKIKMYNPFGQLVKVKEIKLHANTPFYYKTKFYITMIIVITFLFFLFIFFMILSYRIKNKTKSKIAMDLHDESGTILTRLLLISRKEKIEKIDNERIQNGLKEALYSFRTYLDSISRKKQNIQNLIDELNEFIKTNSYEANITTDIKISLESNLQISNELYRDIKLMIYEIFTNSIKHSKADKMSFEFILNNKELNIMICDNGNFNINEIKSIKGNGIRNLKKRISKHNGSISFHKSDIMSGLTVEFKLRIK